MLGRKNPYLFKAKHIETAGELVANRFTAEFIRDFCAKDGAIDWSRIVAFNSATTKPKRVKPS